MMDKYLQYFFDDTFISEVLYNKIFLLIFVPTIVCFVFHVVVVILIGKKINEKYPNSYIPFFFNVLFLGYLRDRYPFTELWVKKRLNIIWMQVWIILLILFLWFSFVALYFAS